MRLLTALPLAGPLLGAAMGQDPVRLYGSEVARAAAGLGVALLALGWLWCRRMVRRAVIW
jgi:tight adherence protein B